MLFVREDESAYFIRVAFSPSLDDAVEYAFSFADEEWLRWNFCARITSMSYRDGRVHPDPDGEGFWEIAPIA